VRFRSGNKTNQIDETDQIDQNPPASSRIETQAARCASTEDHQAPSPPLFREQEDDQVAPSSFSVIVTLCPSDPINARPSVLTDESGAGIE